MLLKNVFHHMDKLRHKIELVQRLERMHPYETMLYLGMVGSGLIFLFLAVAFLFSGLNQLAGLNQHISCGLSDFYFSVDFEWLYCYQNAVAFSRGAYGPVNCLT